MLSSTTTASKHPKQVKTSELDRFKLFFEFVDAPDDHMKNSSKNGHQRAVQRHTDK